MEKEQTPFHKGVYIALFLTTLATLMLELTLTRIFSVTLFYHFAFFAVSIALFGMTFGAVLIHLMPKLFRQANTLRDMSISSGLFGLSLVVGFVLFLGISLNHLAIFELFSIFL